MDHNFTTIPKVELTASLESSLREVVTHHHSDIRLGYQILQQAAPLIQNLEDYPYFGAVVDYWLMNLEPETYASILRTYEKLEEELPWFLTTFIAKTGIPAESITLAVNSSLFEILQGKPALVITIDRKHLCGYKSNLSATDTLWTSQIYLQDIKNMLEGRESEGYYKLGLTTDYRVNGYLIAEIDGIGVKLQTLETRAQRFLPLTMALGAHERPSHYSITRQNPKTE